MTNGTTKEIATTQTKALAPQMEQAGTGIIASDVVVPRILLMQPTSDFVAEGRAKPGDIVRSTTAERIAGPGTVIDFIPLSLPEPSWVIEVKPPKGNKFEFQRIEPRNSSNSQLPWLFASDFDGNEVPPGTPGALEGRRVQRLSLFALLPMDVAADLTEKEKAANGEFPDFNKALMPVQISFRSTSFKAGKEIVSFASQVASFKREIWEAVLQLTCHAEQNEKGNYFVFDVDRSKPQRVPQEYAETVKYWARIVNTSAASLRVDEVSEESTIEGIQQF